MNFAVKIQHYFIQSYYSFYCENHCPIIHLNYVYFKSDLHQKKFTSCLFFCLPQNSLNTPNFILMLHLLNTNNYNFWN